MPCVHANDLLITRANTVELIGAVVLVRKDYPNLLLSDKTLRLVPDLGFVCPEFLLYALRTPWVRRVYEEQATGTSDSMRNLSQRKIRSAPIALPPLEEQQIIATVITKWMSSVEQIRKECDIAMDELTQLDQSILAKAFRGELVPQDQIGRAHV